MKALLLSQYKELNVTDFDKPEIGADDVLVQVKACDNRMVLGVSCGEYRRNGAFAEYVSVPQHICYGLPKELPFAPAAMIEAVSVAVHAANRTPVTLDDTAVVVGSGMIGLLVIQAIRLAGCSQVIAVDLDAGRLAKAKALGADVGLNAGEVDVPAEVRKLTIGRGADVVIEVVGATATIKTVIESARKGGIASPLVAHWPSGIAAKDEWRTQPSHLIDIMATCADVGGATYPKKFNGHSITPLEGRSLVPAFANKPFDREALFWEHEGNAAVRVGDMKLVRQNAKGPWELYDMKADRTEQHNLAQQQPEQVTELSDKWNAGAKRANVIPGPKQGGSGGDDSAKPKNKKKGKAQ